MDNLIESLLNSDEKDFVESCKYGLVVVDETSEIFHFCAYLNKPTEVDKQNLYYELKTDESFGLTDRIDKLTIEEASQEVLDQYIRQLADE